MDPAVIELLKQGGVILALGLGVVFSLLSVLVFAVYGMSYLAGLIDVPLPLPVAAIGEAAAADDSDVVAAITAAVHAHRNRTGVDR